MDHADLHKRATERGVQPIVYRLARMVLVPFFRIYFRLRRTGQEHIPMQGPVIFAGNHRSFLDPFIIGSCIKRPVYYVAKQELFMRSWQAWILNALGAFPVNRGNADGQMLDTARAILDRGDAVLIFPEGSRIRPGSLGRPKRGVGRLALETGAPVVPVAIIGTEAVRRGVRIRPHKVRLRFGRSLTFPRVPAASPALAQAVTERIWPCVMLQWEWLGGLPPLRRAAVVGAGSWGTALAVMLARTGIEVDLATRTADQATRLRDAGANDAYLPGVRLPDDVNVVRAAELELSRHDLVVFAVPASGLPAAVAEHASSIAPRAGVLVCSKGLVAPLGTLSSAYVAQRTLGARIAALAGPAHARSALEGGAALVVGSLDRGLSRQLAELLTRAGLDVTVSSDLTGVEYAGAAKNVAALAAGAAAHGGPNAAGAAAGKVFAEMHELARAAGADGATFSGLAGTGDLVSTVLATGSRNRRAGELLGAGTPASDLRGALAGQTAEAIDTVPLLADRAAAAGVAAPALGALAELLGGRVQADAWTASLTIPAVTPRAA